MSRIISFFCIGASIFLFPWWVGVITALVCSFYFDSYIELVAFAILLDALYGYGMGTHRFLFTVSGVLILLIIPLLKSRLHIRS